MRRMADNTIPASAAPTPEIPIDYGFIVYSSYTRPERIGGAAFREWSQRQAGWPGAPAATALRPPAGGACVGPSAVLTETSPDTPGSLMVTP